MPPEIDIHQLPIPAWDLLCPGCRYVLTGLTSHRCPECGLDLDMADVVQPWHLVRSPTFTGRERPLPDFGLECRSCDEALVGAVGSMCVKCAAPLDLDQFKPASEWFTVDRVIRRGIPMELIEAMLTEEYVPFRIEKDRTYREIYGLTATDPLRIRVMSEFFFDFLRLVRVREEEHRCDVERSSPGEWPCPDCGEKNPGHFDICWSCSADHP